MNLHDLYTRIGEYRLSELGDGVDHFKVADRFRDYLRSEKRLPFLLQELADLLSHVSDEEADVCHRLLKAWLEANRQENYCDLIDRDRGWFKVHPTRHLHRRPFEECEQHYFTPPVGSFEVLVEDNSGTTIHTYRVPEQTRTV